VGVGGAVLVWWRWFGFAFVGGSWRGGDVLWKREGRVLSEACVEADPIGDGGGDGDGVEGIGLSEGEGGG
jgi:hypothetical protein